MPFDNLTQEQKNFITKYLWSGIVGKVLNSGIVADFEGCLRLEKVLQDLIDEIPADHDLHPKLVSGRLDAQALREKGEFSDGVKALETLIGNANNLKVQIADRCKSLREQADAAEQVKGSTDHERKHLAPLAEAVRVPLKAVLPSKADILTSANALEALRTEAGKVTTRGRTLETVAALEKTHPKAAAKAREVIALFTEAPAKLAAAQEALAEAERLLDEAEKMPVGKPIDPVLRRRRQEAIEAAEERVGEKARIVNTAEREAVKFSDPKRLTDALRFGALSPDAPKPFSDAAAEKLLAAFGKNPGLAADGVEIAARAPHPDKVADGIGQVADGLESRFRSRTGATFPDEGKALAYAKGLLSTGGQMGGDYFDRLGPYVDSGAHLTKDPLGELPAKSFESLALNRTRALAASMLSPDGDIDLDSAAADQTFAHFCFNATVLSNPTPVLHDHVQNTLAFLKKGDNLTKTKDILDGSEAPVKNSGKFLIGTSVGKTTAPTEDDMKQALLTSMLRPFAQGPVGSCFATAPLLRLREQDPLKVMEMCRDMAVKGYLETPGKTRAILMTNLPEGSDPLLRSLEYTLAATAARAGGSKEKKSLGSSLSSGLDQLGVALSDKLDWKIEKPKLLNEMYRNLDFSYDPTVELKDSSDGSSSKGRYVIFNWLTGKTILTKDAFIAAAQSIALKSLGPSLSTSDKKEVERLIASDSFVDACCRGNYKPWELSGGGNPAQVMTELMGEEMITDITMLPKIWIFGGSEDSRSKKVLGTIINDFGSSTNKMEIIGTTTHSFNALPNDPTLAKLKGKDSKEVDTNIERELVEPGRKIRDTELDAGRAAFLFDKEMQGHLDQEEDDEGKRLIAEGIKANRPKKGMKPADLSKAVMAAMKEANALRADDAAKTWENTEINKGKVPTSSEYDKKKQELMAQEEKKTDDRARANMILDLGAPEFRFADTNWGSSQNHTFFVIAPDPVSGDTRIWMKAEPPGSLTLAPEKWANMMWDKVI